MKRSETLHFVANAQKNIEYFVQCKEISQNDENAAKKH